MILGKEAKLGALPLLVHHSAVCLMNYIPGYCSKNISSLYENMHLFQMDIFQEGHSFPAFLGLPSILGPVAQIMVAPKKNVALI